MITLQIHDYMYEISPYIIHNIIGNVEEIRLVDIGNTNGISIITDSDTKKFISYENNIVRPDCCKILINNIIEIFAIYVFTVKGEFIKHLLLSIDDYLDIIDSNKIELCEEEYIDFKINSNKHGHTFDFTYFCKFLKLDKDIIIKALI